MTDSGRTSGVGGANVSTRCIVFVKPDEDNSFCTNLGFGDVTTAGASFVVFG